MTEAFGTYDDLGEMFGSEEAWKDEARKPALPEGNFSFIITDFERKENPQSGAVSMQFTFQPYTDADGMPVSTAQSTLTIKHMFYVGKKVNGHIQPSPFRQILNDFLRSIDMTPEKQPQLKNGTSWMFTKNDVKGIVVSATVYWETILSNKAHPETGVVPTEIDPDDPSTFSVFAKLKDIRGVRADGVVQKIFI